MPGVRPRDYAKERYWRKVFADWKISALSGAEYCRRHDIPYNQFHDWRKVITSRDADVAARTAELQAEHRKRLAPKKKAAYSAIAAKERREQSTVEGVEFAEAQLVDHPDAEVCAIESKPNMQAYLEIVFRNSITVRVQSGCPLQLLSSVVLLLED